MELLLISAEVFKTVLTRLESIKKAKYKILALLKSKHAKNSESLDYVGEKRAIEIIGKRAACFLQMRSTGQLNFTKVGAKVFFSLDELKSLLNKGGKL